MREDMAGSRLLIVSTVTLLAWAPAIAILSSRFGAQVANADKPILWFVAMQVIAGLAYLGALYGLRAVQGRRLWLFVMVALGLWLRLALMGSTPILEDDYNRYLLDGATMAQGLDPYAYSPEELLLAGVPLSWEMRLLVEQGRPVIEQVNHSTLRTIYPPVAQWAFAVAYHVRPWDLLGLRLVWLGLDVLTLGLLVWGLSPPAGGAVRVASLAVYWLNPLLVKEVYNSAHMEMIVLLAATAGLVLAARKNSVGSGVMLALGVGAKLWPVLWLGLIVRWFRAKPRQAVLGLVAFALTLAVVLSPMMTALSGEGSGLLRYTQRWEMNDTAFMLILWPLQWLNTAHAPLVARAVVAVMVIVWAAWLGRRPMHHAGALYGRALAVVAMMFLWSPTQFPWYALWLLPVAALAPHWPLQWLTVTLPLYYLRFFFVARGSTSVFDYGIVWIEFVPIWVMLVVWWWRSRQLPGRVVDA